MKIRIHREDIPAWIPLVILAVVLILLFAPLLFGVRFLFWGLPSLQFYPWREYAFDEISQGRLPFLNPYNGAGVPLIANYQSAIFYPPNWLHLLLPDAYAMNLIAVLHLFWAGLGMWSFMRLLRTNELGLGVSTLCFALASYEIGRIGSFPTQNVVAWLPWLLWSIMSLFEKRQVLYVGLLGTITAMMLLAGHAQTAFYGFVMAGIFTLWALIWYLRALPPRTRFILLLLTGAGVLLGIGIASSQLLLTGELLAQSQRSGGVDYDVLTNLSFAPLRSFVIFMPNFFGSPVDGSYLTPDKGIYFEDAIYIGIVPLLAAIAAVIGWLQRRKFLEHWQAFRSVPLWILIAVIGFALALGKHNSLYYTLYQYVPTFDNFREPVRWMILPVFALSVLAGIGVQNWGRSPTVFFWTRLSGAAGAGMLVMAIAGRYFLQSDVKALPVLLEALTAFGAWLLGAALLTLAQPDETWNVPRFRWQMAVLVFVAADLAWAAVGLNPAVGKNFYRAGTFTEPQGRLYWFEDYEDEVKYEDYFDTDDYRNAVEGWPGVRNSLLPNLNMIDEVEVFNTFDPLKPQNHVQYYELIEQLGADSGNLLAAAGVGQVYGNVQPQGWLPIEGKEGYASPEPPVQAWIVPTASWFEEEGEVIARLSAEDWLPRNEVILMGQPPPDNEIEPLTEVTFFETMENSPHQKRFRVENEGSGYLVLATTWYPGWSVSVDGVEQPLYRANLAFMAVALPPGGGEVSFEYMPSIGLPGIMLSFISLCVTLGLIALGLARQTDFR